MLGEPEGRIGDRRLDLFWAQSDLLFGVRGAGALRGPCSPPFSPRGAGTPLRTEQVIAAALPPSF